MLGSTPVVGARVQFVPDAAIGAKVPISSGVTDEKGFFRLMRDDNGKPGAALGKHKVTVIAGRLEGPRSRDDEPAQPRSGTPVRKDYNSVASTPLEVEVKADQKTYPLTITAN
jgi:hypothetical protein